MGLKLWFQRAFGTWHRIPRHKVPKWVRGKLHKRRYVRDRKREYEVIIEKGKTEVDVGIGMEHPTGEHYYLKKWKSVKYYYRKLK